MDLYSKSRSRKLNDREISDRAARSFLRQRGNADDNDNGLRRSLRGKIQVKESKLKLKFNQKGNQAGKQLPKASRKVLSDLEKSGKNSTSSNSQANFTDKATKEDQEKEECHVEAEGEVLISEIRQDEKQEVMNKSNGIDMGKEYVSLSGNDSDDTSSSLRNVDLRNNSIENNFEAESSKPILKSEYLTNEHENDIEDQHVFKGDVFEETQEGVDEVSGAKRRRIGGERQEEVGLHVNQSNSDKNVKEMGRTDDSAKFVVDKKYEPSTKKSRIRLSMVEKLQPSKGFVNKVEPNLTVEGVIPMKRTPRMASLNAIAKVNAVLESYSPLPGKAVHDLKEKATGRKAESIARTKPDRKQKRRTSSVTQTDDTGYYPPLKEDKEEWYVSSATSTDLFSDSPNSYQDQPISDSRVSSTSNWNSEDDCAIMTKDKAVQTMVNHKAVQTDSSLMQDRASGASLSGLQNCTCNNNEINMANESMGRTTYRIPPIVSSNTLNVPLRSSILTKTTAHSIAIPFTKTHVLSHMDMEQIGVSTPVTNINSRKRMASLNAIAMMNAMKILDKPFLHMTHLSRPCDSEKSHRPASNHIRIPKINFQATSTSKFSGKGRISNPIKPMQMKNLSSQIERLIEYKKADPRPSYKMVNGWLFDGEPMEKPFAYDEKVVIRRYYTSMRRNAEVINVRDAVLLKSGPRKKDLPFVARVAAIWEEEEGSAAGDMMISVFWYYRPEQTEVGKLSGYHGELEVLASRHRDDNSAACVVDKCYVLSYPQYCRFRARNKLFRESRKAPLSPVPPTESTRPGSMPPANTDPNLVFFCRHAYDSRTGKILKNPFY